MKPLSHILQEMGRKETCSNEQSFEQLALVVSDIPYKTCTFIEEEKYIDAIKQNVTMVITTAELAPKVVTEKRGVIISEEPRILFFKLHNFLQQEPEYCGASYPTQIAESAVISNLSDISKTNVIIKGNVVIESFVKIYPNVTIGKNSIIRAGSVIGGEGFEFKRITDGILPVKHLGWVSIGENVEIQNNTCIDKAVYPWDQTSIGNDSKVDNLVHIAHAVKIGERVMVVANSGIGGRTEISKDTWIGFGATIKNGITIGHDARANMGAVVTKSIADGGSVSGNFAIDHTKFIENIKKIAKGNQS